MLNDDAGFRLLPLNKTGSSQKARPLPGKFGCATKFALLRDRYAKCCVRCERRCAKANCAVGQGHRPGLSRDRIWAAVSEIQTASNCLRSGEHCDWKKRLVVNYQTNSIPPLAEAKSPGIVWLTIWSFTSWRISPAFCSKAALNSLISIISMISKLFVLGWDGKGMGVEFITES